MLMNEDTNRPKIASGISISSSSDKFMHICWQMKIDRSMISDNIFVSLLLNSAILWSKRTIRKILSK